MGKAPVTDALWEIVEPLPPPKPRRYRCPGQCLPVGGRENSRVAASGPTAWGAVWVPTGLPEAFVDIACSST
jgi:transposase